MITKIPSFYIPNFKLTTNINIASLVCSHIQEYTEYLTNIAEDTKLVSSHIDCKQFIVNCGILIIKNYDIQ